MNSIEGSSGVGKDFSLKDMYDALLDMKSNVDLLLNWIKLGLGLVGSNGFSGKHLQMDFKKDGLDSRLGHKGDISGKGKNIVVGPGIVKSPKRVWKVKPCIGISGVSGLECSSSMIAPPLI